MNFEDFKKKYQKVESKEFWNSVIENPIVSVCVQTYQHVNYIRECLDGILMQETSFPFEIILGEDDSKDGTREICKEYAERYPKKIRLFLHHRENNIKIDGQPTGRFNFMYNIYSARGKYIALCEGDDYWTDPLKLQKQINFLEKNSRYSYCAHNSQRLKEGEFISNQLNSHTITFNRHIYSNYINTCTLILRKEYLHEIPRNLLEINALDWWIQLWALKKADGYFLEDDMAVYRVHGGGIWNRLTAKEMCMRGVKILKRFRKIFTSLEDKKNIDLAIAKRKKDFGY